MGPMKLITAHRILITAGIAFLARPDSTYITGTVLNVDGGYGA